MFHIETLVLIFAPVPMGWADPALEKIVRVNGPGFSHVQNTSCISINLGTRQFIQKNNERYIYIMHLCMSNRC
jgi:hypothetical protein